MTQVLIQNKELRLDNHSKGLDQMKHLLAITGASGFMGNYISKQLPYKQKCLTRQNGLPSHENCEWINGNISKSTDIHNLLQQTSTLIHLACTSHPRSTESTMALDIQHNLIPSIQLFEAFAKLSPGGHIIFSSSGGNMYDDTPDNILRRESDPPRPRSPYAAHKLATENFLRLCCEKYGIKGSILRISNPYGILLSKERTQGLIGVALSKLSANEPLEIFDSLETTRDYIHLDDIVKAFELVIQHPPKAGTCEVFNVSSGKGHTINEVLKAIEEMTQKSIIKKVSLPLPPPSWSVLSSLKLEQMLGWKPQISLIEGLKRIEF